MKFDEMGLSKPLLDALQTMGFGTPTPIQEQAIPVLLQGHDLIGQAQTGTGKTAAFGLPILERWIKEGKTNPLSANPSSASAGHLSHPLSVPMAHTSRSGVSYHSRAPQPVRAPRIGQPSALILVPTRELAVQVHQSLCAMAQHTHARIVPIYGGIEMRKQLRYFNSPVDIVVGTPGRTLDHMRQGTLRLDGVHTVVLDEADRMLDMGFIRDVVKILESTPHTRQTLLFSATMPREITQIAFKYMKKPQTIKVSEDTLTVDLIDQLYVRVNSANRFGMLVAAIRKLKPFLSLVFTRTKHDSKKLARMLNMNGITADAMHGNLRQNARERTMAAFRDGQIDVLVATDLASRGIDVREITHVFNYDLPDDPMVYVHRIGRTGRAGAKGVAVSLVMGDPRRAVEIIQRATGAPIAELELSADEVIVPERSSHERMDNSNRHRQDRRPSHGRREEGSHSGPSHSGSPHSGTHAGSHPSHPSGPRPPPGAHHHSSHRRR